MNLRNTGLLLDLCDHGRRQKAADKPCIIISFRRMLTSTPDEGNTCQVVCSGSFFTIHSLEYVIIG